MRTKDIQVWGVGTHEGSQGGNLTSLPLAFLLSFPASVCSPSPYLLTFPLTCLPSYLPFPASSLGSLCALSLPHLFLFPSPIFSFPFLTFLILPLPALPSLLPHDLFPPSPALILTKVWNPQPYWFLVA